MGLDSAYLNTALISQYGYDKNSFHTTDMPSTSLFEIRVKYHFPNFIFWQLVTTHNELLHLPVQLSCSGTQKPRVIQSFKCESELPNEYLNSQSTVA